MATYSTIIKNGTILEGSADKRRFQADIAIKDGKIEKVEKLKDEKAETVIDASDMYVAPGFIDLTTHSDTHWTLIEHPGQESFLRQGVTTIVGGHGGASLAPLIKKDSVKLLGKWTDIETTNINWQTFGELFQELEKHELGVNFATLVGHENLRRNVHGNELKEANKKEIKEMCALLEQSLDEGAFGFSTNLGTPFTSTASNEEVTELLKTCSNRSVFTSHHLENEGKNLLPAVSRLIMFLRNSGAMGHIAHFKALGQKAWGDFENAVNMIELAQKDDLMITCDFFPYTRTGSSLTSILPSWILKEDRSEIIKMLDDPKIKKDLTEYLKSLTLHYEKITIAFTLHDTNSTGRNIKDLSEDSGLTEEEIVLNLLKVNELQVSIFSDIVSMDHLELLSQKPYAAISSDGVGYELSKLKSTIDFAHPRSFGTFPKFFSQFVREKALLSWEDAIYKMSGYPATLLGLKNRGAIKVKNFADIVILDPLKIKDNSTYDDPWHYSDGIEQVFISGELVMSKNKIVKSGAGQILKRE
jgi:N-acyl-D-amino-acid deacylase